MLPKRKAPFADARRRRHGGRAPRKGFDPNQPRGGDGRWIPTGRRIEEVASLAGENVAVHVAFGAVRKAAAVSKISGVEVRGFRHAISNQAIAHMRRGHPNLIPEDFGRLPDIVKAGLPRLGKDRGVNGVPRLIYRATVSGVQYEYVGEVRRRKRRIDAITLYRL